MEGLSFKAKALAAVLSAAALLACLPAPGDEITLVDGRHIVGQITERGDVITIQTAESTLMIPAAEVAEIKITPPAASQPAPELPQPPPTENQPPAPAAAQPAPPPSASDQPALPPTALLEDQLRQRLATVDPADTAALFDAAMWASRNGLEREAAELLARVIGLDTDNAKARQALRQVRIGSQWYSLAQAAQILSADACPAGYDPATTAIIQQMRLLAQQAEEKAAVEALAAHTRLCQGAIAEAAGVFARLAQVAPAGSATRTRLATIADILSQNPDGLYVLTESYPSEAVLLDKPGRIVPAGPASLADRRVLTAALRDRARGFLAEGARQLDQARQLPATDLAPVEQACQRALAQFDQADALVADIARSYRVDVARCRIDSFSQRAKDAAAAFDIELAALGRQELSRQDYAAKLAKMLSSARKVRQDLETILRIAQPYPRDLVMEIRWAQEDRTKMQAIQDTLRQELHEAR